MKEKIIAIFLIVAITSIQTNAQEVVYLSTQSSNEDILADLWQENNLPSYDIPTYNYFTKSDTGYSLGIKNEAACAVKMYAGQNGMENEEWELRRILCNDGIYHAYVESATGNELYILLLDTETTYMSYIITADIRNSNDAEISIHVEGQGQDGPSYNSMLEWNSYLQWFQDGTDKKGLKVVESAEYLHDSVYADGLYCALYDYLDRTGRDIKDSWTIDSNSVYVGTNGCIADIYCTNGEEGISMLIDVWNKRYVVLRCG